MGEVTPATDACTTAADEDCDGTVNNGCAYASCLALRTDVPGAPSGVYTLDADGAGPGAPFQAYCEMAVSGGGWTLAMKVDGNQTTFSYDAATWLDDTVLNPGSPGLDATEAKLASYGAVPLTDVLIGMVDGGATRYLAVPAGAHASLRALISPDGFVPTSLGREAWRGLMASGSLQLSCNREGFNVRCDAGDTRVRIGIVTNNEPDCGGCDSRLGVGAYGQNGGQNPGNAAGNEALWDTDAGDRSTRAFAYVFVR